MPETRTGAVGCPNMPTTLVRNKTRSARSSTNSRLKRANINQWRPPCLSTSSPPSLSRKSRPSQHPCARPYLPGIGSTSYHLKADSVSPPVELNLTVSRYHYFRALFYPLRTCSDRSWRCEDMFFSVFQECLLLLSDCCGMCWSGVVDGGMCWSGVVDCLIWILRAKNCVLCVESEKGAVFWWLVMALGSFLFFLGCLSFWAQFWGGACYDWIRFAFVTY